ncbi:hypothetical protein Pelo_14446 [Pelomyxa schiedti]|nr:hypothetical protein Pelo_14446 [Pelomyxa schiedti]
MGTHPRCGAACPLANASSGSGGDYGILVVRLVWSWLWCRSSAADTDARAEVVGAREGVAAAGGFQPAQRRGQVAPLLLRPGHIDRGEDAAAGEGLLERIVPRQREVVLWLLWCHSAMADAPLSGTTHLVLVDIAQTYSLKKLVVLSSTAPQWRDLNPYHCAPLIAMAHQPLFNQASVIIIEEGTGRLQLTQKSLQAEFPSVSPVSQSEYCVFGFHKHKYEVWDVNNPRKPVRIGNYLPSCTMSGRDAQKAAFVEGGFLFQMSESMKEMHVTEEFSGDHVITLLFFRPISILIHTHSFPLSGGNKA